MLDWSRKFDPAKIGIEKNAALDPGKIAFITGDKRVSFGQLYRESNALAHVLLTLGMQPGDNLASLFHNSSETYMIWAAAAQIGVTALALNFKLKGSEVAYILEDSRCKLLLYDHHFQGLVEELKQRMPNAAPIMIRAGAGPSADPMCLETLMARGSCRPVPRAEPSRQVPPTLAYTSGTTGRPKGVFRCAANRLHYLILQAYLFGAEHHDVHLVAGPLYHAAPFAWGAFSLLLGGTVIVMPKFDAETFLRLVAEHRVTTTFMVPTMMHRILHLPAEIRDRYDRSSLRSITIAGEPFPFAMKQRTIECFGEGKIYEFYGGTELGVVTYLRPEDQLRKPGSCGQPIEDEIDILILDAEKKPVPAGEVGVLYVKSPYLLDGYHNNAEATKACFHQGYFTVGDMGYVDGQGYYYIVDRAVDMVISGGVNIYPAEIEEILYRRADLNAAAVIGVPDPEWGEKLVAYVVPRPGAAADAQRIMAYIGDHLAAYKRPKEIIFVDALPTSSTGKVLKRELKKGYQSRLNPRDT